MSLLFFGLPVNTIDMSYDIDSGSWKSDGHPGVGRWTSPFISNDPGLGTVVGIGAAAVALILLFLFTLVLGGQFATLPSLFPASNSTKITTNIANGVVTGSNFLQLIYLGVAIAIVIVVFALAFKAFGMLKTSGRG